jgi:2-polyprenyl-3-methyl-5-hydroxy-6-metoxy-1,4-benzoquinol methylase
MARMTACARRSERRGHQISPHTRSSHLQSTPLPGTHDWRKFLQPQELARFGRAAGLAVRDVSGLVYNPITGAWRLAKEDTDVNYAMHLRLRRAAADRQGQCQGQR